MTGRIVGFYCEHATPESAKRHRPKRKKRGGWTTKALSFPPLFPSDEICPDAVALEIPQAES